MSNPASPGRVIGDLLSSAGSSVKRRLGKLAYCAGLGSYAKAERILVYSDLLSMFVSEDVTQKEKACNILLGYANSDNPVIQIIAFDLIIHYALVFPPLPSVAEMVCGKRKEHIDVVTFSWKRQGVNYSSLWLCYYDAALRCLSTHSNSDKNILACCKDVPDTRIVIECMFHNWNGGGTHVFSTW